MLTFKLTNMKFIRDDNLIMIALLKEAKRIHQEETMMGRYNPYQAITPEEQQEQADVYISVANERLSTLN